MSFFLVVSLYMSGRFIFYFFLRWPNTMQVFITIWLSKRAHIGWPAILAFVFLFFWPLSLFSICIFHLTKKILCFLYCWVLIFNFYSMIFLLVLGTFVNFIYKSTVIWTCICDVYAMHVKKKCKTHGPR